MQLISKKKLKNYLEFDETRHIIKLAKIPIDGFLDEYINRGVLDVDPVMLKHSAG